MHFKIEWIDHGREPQCAPDPAFPNARNHDTGIRAVTRHERGNKRGWAPAQLRVFACGDRFWYGGNFLAWGENVYFRNLMEVDFWGRLGVNTWRLPMSRLR